jgi:hypothetical protein
MLSYVAAALKQPEPSLSLRLRVRCLQVWVPTQFNKETFTKAGAPMLLAGVAVLIKICRFWQVYQTFCCCWLAFLISSHCCMHQAPSVRASVHIICVSMHRCSSKRVSNAASFQWWLVCVYQAGCHRLLLALLRRFCILYPRYQFSKDMSRAKSHLHTSLPVLDFFNPCTAKLVPQLQPSYKP